MARLYGVADFEARARAADRGAGADRQGALAAGRAVARHAAEGGHRLRSGARRHDAPLRRAAHRARSGRHPAHAQDDRRARARGRRVLLSSHLLHLVEEVCTRVIIMDRGRKVADGTVAELASRADLAAAGSNLEQIFLRVTGHDGSASACVRASLYITLCSAQEPHAVRLRRLREPRYLIVAHRRRRLPVFRRVPAARRPLERGAARAAGRRRTPPSIAALAAAGPALGGIGLLALAALAWVLPGAAGCSTFRRPRSISLSGTGDAAAAVDPSSGAVAARPAVRRVRRRHHDPVGRRIRALCACRSRLGGARHREDLFRRRDALPARSWRRGRRAALRVAWTPIVVLVTAVAIVVIAADARVRRRAAVESRSSCSPASRDVAAPGLGARRSCGRSWRWCRPIFADVAGARICGRWPWRLVCWLATVVWVLHSDRRSKRRLRPRPEHRRRPRCSSGARAIAAIGRLAPAAGGRPEGRSPGRRRCRPSGSSTGDRVLPTRALAVRRWASSRFRSAAASGPAADRRLLRDDWRRHGNPDRRRRVVRIDLRRILRHLELLKTWPVGAGNRHPRRASLAGRAHHGASRGRCWRRARHVGPRFPNSPGRGGCRPRRAPRSWRRRSSSRS